MPRVSPYIFFLYALMAGGGILSSTPVVHAFQQTDLLSWQYPTDQQVLDLAIEKGFLNPDSGNPGSDGETAAIWKIFITGDRETKIEFIEQVKLTMAEAEEVTIRKASEYYVDELNIRILNVLKQDKLDYFDKILFSTLFKSLTIMEGDYDDGQTAPLDLIRQWFGEQGIEQMKQEFPERYEALKRR